MNTTKLNFSTNVVENKVIPVEAGQVRSKDSGRKVLIVSQGDHKSYFQMVCLRPAPTHNDISSPFNLIPWEMSAKEVEKNYPYVHACNINIEEEPI